MAGESDERDAIRLIEIYEQKQLAYSWPAEALPIFRRCWPIQSIMKKRNWPLQRNFEKQQALSQNVIKVADPPRVCVAGIEIHFAFTVHLVLRVDLEATRIIYRTAMVDSALY